MTVTTALNKRLRYGRWGWGWAIFLGVTFVSTGAWACPFCSGPTQTLAERYNDSQVIVVAECVPMSPDPAAARENSGQYEVVAVLRDKSAKFKIGQKVAHERTASPGTRTMFLGTFMESKKGLEHAWTELVDVNETVLKYIQEAPAPKQPGRLKYYEKFLEHAELDIANDAYGEFANASYEDIVAVAKTMSPAKIRGWIENPKTPSMRFGLLGMLLGLCGTKEDAVVLEKWVFEKEDKATSGVDGMTYGYLLLCREPGLERLERELLHNLQVSDGVMVDRIKAIRCLWTYAHDRISRDRLARSLHPLLKHLTMAESVIPDLARWKDWRVQTQVAAHYGNPMLKKSTVVAYLVQSAQDIPAKSAELPNHAVQARVYLEALLKRDPVYVSEIPPALRKCLSLPPIVIADKPGPLPK